MSEEYVIRSGKIYPLGAPDIPPFQGISVLFNSTPGKLTRVLSIRKFLKLPPIVRNSNFFIEMCVYEYGCALRSGQIVE